MKGEDGIESLGGRHLQLKIGAIFATSSAVGTCSPHALSVMRLVLMCLRTGGSPPIARPPGTSLDLSGSCTLAFSLGQNIVTGSFVSRGIIWTDARSEILLRSA